MAQLSESTIGNIKQDYEESISANYEFINQWIDTRMNISKGGDRMNMRGFGEAVQALTKLDVQFTNSEQIGAYKDLVNDVISYYVTKNESFLDGIRDSIIQGQSAGHFKVSADMVVNRIRSTFHSSQKMEDYLVGNTNYGDFRQYSEGDTINVGDNSYIIKGFESQDSQNPDRTITHNFMTGINATGEERAFDVRGNSIDIEAFTSTKQEFLDIANDPSVSSSVQESALTHARILDSYMNGFELFNEGREIISTDEMGAMADFREGMSMDEIVQGAHDFASSIENMAQNIDLNEREDHSVDMNVTNDDIRSRSEDLKGFRDEFREKNEGASEEEQTRNQEEYDDNVSSVDREVEKTITYMNQINRL